MTHSTACTRRQLLLAGSASILGVATSVRAQRSDVLRIVCGYAAGGSVDIVARKLAEKLPDHLSATTVVVENKSGAAGRLAVEEVKRAAPGSALLVTPASVITMYPHVFRQLSYDPFTDLLPVSTTANTGFALAVGPKVPAGVTNLQDLVHWCRSRPSAATCGNAGAGSMPHLMTLMASRALNVELTPVPYRGGAAAAQGTAAGDTAMTLATEAAVRPFHQGGKLRVLATTSSTRSPWFADVPTFREAGVDLVQREWFGTFAPARTGERDVQAVSQAIRAVVEDADVREAWERMSLTAEASGPAALAQAMRAEYEYWGRAVRASGFTPES